MFSQESKRPGNPACAAEHLMRDACAKVGCGVKLWQQKLSHVASWDGCFLADRAPARALRGEGHPGSSWGGLEGWGSFQFSRDSD